MRLVAGGLLLVVLTGCGAETTVRPRLPPATATVRPSSPTPERVGPGGQSDPRAERLLARIRQALPTTAAVLDSGEVRTAETGRSAAYRAGILVRPARGGYAALSAELIDPPVTFGDASCAPWMHVCDTREIPGDHTAVITGDNASPTVMVEVYRSDKGVPLRLRATREVTDSTSLFWQGGTPAVQVPVDVDALVRLAGSLATDPV